MIEVNNLVKCYGRTTAVNELSFKVEKGQIYGFLGPNGAGKTTTMNILTGYLAPTSGEVIINGHNILKEAEEARKCIGYLPEIPPLYPDMTVGEYLEFAAGLKKIPGSERSDMIFQAMELTGLLEVQGRLIKNLSKGFRQRVGLAQAILGFPEIMILDEPMVGLDPKQIIEIRELIRKLSEKHTIILSSHILSEISAMCDHIMIIAHGQLVASDTPENLTKLMQGSSEIELTIKGSRSSIKNSLDNIGSIESYSITESSEPGEWDVLVKAKGKEDPREKLFYAMAEQKTPILSMKYKHISLEDVFLELTEDSDKEKGQTDQEGEKKKGLMSRIRKVHPQDKQEETETNEGGNEN